jgi:hypothetical protein
MIELQLFINFRAVRRGDRNRPIPQHGIVVVALLMVAVVVLRFLKD